MANFRQMMVYDLSGKSTYEERSVNIEAIISYRRDNYHGWIIELADGKKLVSRDNPEVYLG